MGTNVSRYRNANADWIELQNWSQNLTIYVGLFLKRRQSGLN